MFPDNKFVEILLFIGLAAINIVCLHGQSDNTQESPVSQTGSFTRNILKTYNGKSLIPGKEMAYVQFTLMHKDPNLLTVLFNASSETDSATSKNFTPEAFGMMFLGEENRYVGFEIDKSGKNFVHICNGFNMMLLPKQDLKVSFKQIVSDEKSWNGTVDIPVDYFPRSVQSMAAYANYTEQPDKKHVLSLVPVSSSDDMEDPMPNLEKSTYFQDVVLSKYFPDLKFGSYSKLWQDALSITEGGSPAANSSDTSSDHQAHTGHGNSTATKMVPMISAVSFAAIILTLH